MFAAIEPKVTELAGLISAQQHSAAYVKVSEIIMATQMYVRAEILVGDISRLEICHAQHDAVCALHHVTCAVQMWRGPELTPHVYHCMVECHE